MSVKKLAIKSVFHDEEQGARCNYSVAVALVDSNVQKAAVS